MQNYRYGIARDGLRIHCVPFAAHAVHLKLLIDHVVMFRLNSKLFPPRNILPAQQLSDVNSLESLPKFVALASA
jgi:hypothetical protein